MRSDSLPVHHSWERLSGLLVLLLSCIVLACSTTAVRSAPAEVTIDSWTATTPLPQGLASRNAVPHGDFIYIVGGKNRGDTPVDLVYAAQIQTDGTLSEWQVVATLPVPVYLTAAVASEHHLYVIGGWDGEQTRAEIWRATFEADGRLGSFDHIANYPHPLDLHQAVIVQNRLYVIGGWTGEAPVQTVYTSEISENGLSPWVVTQPLPQPLYRMAAATAGDVIYITGGFGPTTAQAGVYYTRVQPDGTLAPWQSTTPLPTPMDYHATVVHDGRLLLLGGRNEDIAQQQVYAAPIQLDGTLGLWLPELALPEPLYRFAAASVTRNGSDMVYLFGGRYEGEYRAAVYRSNFPQLTNSTDSTLSPQPLLANEPTPVVTLTPRPSGSGRAIDLIWNIIGKVNRITVEIAVGNGSFQRQPSLTLTNHDWQGYEMLTGDVNGDSLTDLIWNKKSEEENRFLVALASRGGAFSLLPFQQHRGRIWQGFQTLSGDVNGDGQDDLIWNELNEAHNRIYVGLSTGNRAFTLLNFQDHRGGRWQGFRTFIGDVNGDGQADLIWNETNEAHNRIYVGLANGDGTFALLDFQEQGRPRWQDFQLFVEDVNGDGRDDLIWNETIAAHNRTYVGLANGDGTFAFLPFQDRAEPGWQAYQTLVGDINGDGNGDLVWNRISETQNQIAVALSMGDGRFDFQPIQEYAVADWGAAQTRIGDINGDGRDDLLWYWLTDSGSKLSIALSDGLDSFERFEEQAIARSEIEPAQLLLGHMD
jgi:hypothetical protein